jgi:hypothetical protein
MAGKVGFFAALIDFSFAESVTLRLEPVTLRLAKGAYGVAVAVAAVGVVVSFAAGMTQSPTLGVVSLVIAVSASLFGIMVVRLWLEMMVVLFRIAEHTEEIAEQVAGIAGDTATHSQVEQVVDAESAQA